MTRIAIITGSTRPGRKSPDIAAWVHQIASRRNDADYGIVDLADHDLPHLEEPVAAAMTGDYRHPYTRRWSETIAAFDGYVFITPEYNHSMPGVLKNAIDHLYTEWHDKPAGFVGYGTHGGTRAVEQLRLVMGELHIADVRAQVALSLFTDFHNGTDLAPGDHQVTILNTMLDQVTRWANALAPLRVSSGR
jgi:NAD(P)H-dependent FMN reductase